MNKNSIIAILGILVGLMAITFIVREIRGRGSEPMPEPIEVDTPMGPVTVVPVEENAPTSPSEWKNSSITGESVDRLPVKRVITSDFAMSGQGSYAKWGRGLNAGFRQYGVFVAEATVVDRQKLGNGRFKVVEDRTFLTARETLEIADADYFLALDTLPIEEVSSALDTAGSIVKAVSGVLASVPYPKLAKAGAIGQKAGEIAQIAANGLRLFKHANNGKPLKEFGIDLSDKARQKVESELNNLSRTPKEIESIVRNVEGRTYRFTYIQNGTGEPVNVTAERVIDGKTTPVETEEEVWILCRCNAFIDAEFLKDGGETIPQPGVPWTVNARSVAKILGVDGYCDGNLTCCRTDGGSAPDGLWEFSLNPAQLDVTDDNGRKLGKISVGGGKANVYRDGRTLHDLTIKGTGKLSRVNKNSILFLPFNERLIGDCHFAGKMTTEVK